MTNWTREQRYRPYSSYSEAVMKKLTDNVAKSPWRASFHIEPETGLLNDPNGFSYFNGRWHLFYQAFPYGPVHGLKSWQHLTSEDLVHFERDKLQILPDTDFENHGCYSGSALPLGDKLFLMYTGNHRDAADQRIPYQLGAWLDDKNQLVKFDRALIEADFTEVTEHFRDPNLVKFDRKIYALLGAQNPDKQGFVKLYQAKDEQMKNWQALGRLNFSQAQLGYMVECPNLVFIEGRPVLIFCPQGLDKSELDYDNVYPNTYVLGEAFEPEQLQIKGDGLLHNLDDGFDCYATQAFNAPDGRALAISWLGLPDTTDPTDQYDYQGALSLVKELTLKNGKLYQYPVEAVKSLRQTEKRLTVSNQPIASSRAFELVLDKVPVGVELKILGEALSVKFDRNKITLKRGSEQRVSQVEAQTVRIFIDHSIFEIFVNQGEKVLSGRVFPSEAHYALSSSAPIDLRYWELKNDR